MEYNKIIQILKSYTTTNNEELGEQESAPSSSSWRSLYKITRVKANTLL